MHAFKQLAFLSACSCVLAACAQKGTESGGTLGDQGRVEFTYQSGCFFGCPLEQPLLVGTRQSINVSDPGDVPGIRISASKSKVAEFALERVCFCEHADHSSGKVDIAEDGHCQGIWQKHCDNTVLVQANAAGDTRLELHDKNGNLIDEVPVLVREAMRAKLEATYADRLGAVKVGSIDLKAHDKVQLDLSLYDDMGRKLLAPEGVSWSVDDDQVATLVAWLVGNGKQVSAGLGIELDAKAPGKTSLTISVPGLDKSFDVNVTQ